MKKFLLGLITGIAIMSLVGCGEQVNQRNLKDQESSEYGLNRTLDVYSYDGKLLRHYEGKFDIASNTDVNGGTTGSKVKFDLDGKRHLIYNAIVITDEK